MPPRQEDEEFMRRAIELAKQGASTPGASPIGCVIVRDGEVIAEAHNEVDVIHDPTAHAEVVAMRRAGQKLALTSDARSSSRYSPGESFLRGAATPMRDSVARRAGDVHAQEASCRGHG